MTSSDNNATGSPKESLNLPSKYRTSSAAPAEDAPGVNAKYSDATIASDDKNTLWINEHLNQKTATAAVTFAAIAYAVVVSIPVAVPAASTTQQPLTATLTVGPMYDTHHRLGQPTWAQLFEAYDLEYTLRDSSLRECFGTNVNLAQRLSEPIPLNTQIRIFLRRPDRRRFYQAQNSYCQGG